MDSIIGFALVDKLTRDNLNYVVLKTRFTFPRYTNPIKLYLLTYIVTLVEF